MLALVDFSVSSLFLLFSSVRDRCLPVAFRCAVSLATTIMVVGSDRWVLPLVIGNCIAAVVVILPQRYWRDADGRCFCLWWTMMALSGVLFVSPSTGFGATQMGVVIMTDNDGVLRLPVCVLFAYWGP